MRFPEHFDGKRFFNPGAPQARGFRDVLRWQRTSRPERSPAFVNDVTAVKPPAKVEVGLRVTLVNHSTVLLQQRKLHVLTDPIWAERATPVRGLGPRRRRLPGVRLEDLPRIDLVLLSHNHYDHLDLSTLRVLAKRGESQFIVPSKVAKLLEVNGIGPVRELDWGASTAVGDCRIHGVPALHFSARGLFDRNHTLWCGYMVETDERMVYFAGDTGFGDHFAMIREQFGAPQVALLPIGAYEPRWFMSPIHMGPEEAVQAHEILGAKTSIAIHHGTFQLADEGLDTPRRRLRECGSVESFLIPANGEAVELA